MRKFLPEQVHNEQEIERRLRINDPSAIYARRSDPTAKDAKRDKSQSREMQTDDLIKWGGRQGWKRDLLFEYFADLGLSGTLRPDQRPDMLRLFDDIDAGKFDNGTIICYQENRLFRDETHIYDNQFIDKCRSHNILVVVISPRLTIYDLRDDMLRDIFRQKLKEAAEYIPRHIKGWLQPARERAAWEYGEWAGMGGLPPGFIVDYDPDSTTYKMPIPYWPHIEKNKETFQLFIELGGDISLFYNRLRKSPIVYPEFESWVDRKSVNIFQLSKYPGGGYYFKSKGALVNLLTHPLHYGYRPINNVIRRDEQGNKIREFDPVMEVELLDFAYYRLADTDFDGNLINQDKPPRRYFHEGSDGQYGLLKYRIISNQGEVRTRRLGEYNEASFVDIGIYIIETINNSDYLYHPIRDTAIPAEELNTIIVKRLMEHIRSISKKQDDIVEYEKRAAKQRAERQKKEKQIDASINDINRNQAGLTLSLGSVELEIEEAKQTKDTDKQERLKRRKELITEQIDILETERRKLIQAKADLEKEANKDIGSLDEELEGLEKLWDKYDFERRRTLINFAIREVVIDCMSTHWIRIQILWLHEEWGREQMFYYRRKGKRKDWTNEEKKILSEHYLSMPALQLMALLPDRSWRGIRSLGSQIAETRRIRECRKEEPIPGWIENYSHSDLAFMREQNIEGKVSYTNWTSLSWMDRYNCVL